MKKLMTSFLALTILAFVSCKKDHDDVPTPAGIAGTYTLYEVEQYNPPSTHALPNDEGEHGKLIVTVSSETAAKVQLLLYKNDQKEADETFDCKIGKDADGDIFLTTVDDNKNAAYFFDNEVDFYAVPGFRLGDRK
ncbi:hypothetical protein SAMN04488505_11016 [Chitinophaga rupis]|uniref:Lipocalin-like domain-containing protein n=1 Tax=Chitinophaga rupis TaxID=573321 RepID=A0A1H8G3B3_9BACT|nr:hypothetical protein [Chitinophaga rupis]SEN38270.1 hypothetical protein SAMN04488505_11016 [Chitinophaga rupis]